MRAHQVRLQQANGLMQTCWVDAGLKLRVGQAVTGKDGARWAVIAVYPRIVVETVDLHTDWKVGGLT